MAEIYEKLKQTLEAEELVALATVVAGPGMGDKLLIWPDGRSEGNLEIPMLKDQFSARRILCHPLSPFRCSWLYGRSCQLITNHPARRVSVACCSVLFSFSVRLCRPCFLTFARI